MAAPRIDLTKVLGLDKTGMERRMRRIGLVAVSAIAAKARTKLNTTLAAYVRALRTVDATRDRVTVELGGQVPNMVEQGMGPGGIGTSGPYDVRTFLLKPGTKSLRRSKEGHQYLHVPFGLSGEQVRAVGGAGALGAARSLLPTLSTPGGGTLWGGRLSGGALAGLVRVQKTYAAARQSGFRMWRTVSDNPDSARSGAYSSWLSGGIEARRIFEASKDAIAQAIARVM